MRILLLIFCFSQAGAINELQWLKRIYAFQLLQDDHSASQEAENALKECPESRPLWQAYIKALAKGGNERGVNLAFAKYCEKFENPFADKELLESMAWGVIGNGIRSPYPNVRLIGMLGAFFSQDAKGVEVLRRGLNDQNTQIRAQSLKLAGHLRDAKLQDEVLKRFRNESNWDVRQEAIRAIGEMRIAEAKGELLSILTNSRSTAEEKALAIQATVKIMDTAEREEVEGLIKSDRAGLRLLACQLVEHFDLERDVDLILPLLKDYHPDIRSAAIHAITAFRATEVKGQAVIPLLEPLLFDPDRHVALTACWAMTIYDPEKGQNFFEPWLNHPSVENNRIASSALAATGKYGVDLMKKTFLHSKDLYVRMNLGLGLVSQRVFTEEACAALYDGVVNSTDRWIWEQTSFFRVLAPTKMFAHKTLMQNPEEANQLIRLDILNTLALLKDPNALNAIKRYLQKKQWGITGIASIALLKEGDESAIQLVQQMMSDPDPQVSFQAALIVALWGRGESAVQILQQAYESASRETKEQILEGLGRIGSPLSIPFLTGKLQEPAQPLRLIAAATLLQCLYH
jgi:HEAT repeat protein